MPSKQNNIKYKRIQIVQKALKEIYVPQLLQHTFMSQKNPFITAHIFVQSLKSIKLKIPAPCLPIYLIDQPNGI